MKQLKSLKASKQKAEFIDVLPSKKKNILQLPDEDDIIDLSSQSIPDDQIQSYAEIIGIRLPTQKHLLYIAKEGLLAQLPDEWTYEQLPNGQIVYLNRKTKERSMEHPCDNYYRQKVIIERKKKIIPKSVPKLQLPKAKATFKKMMQKNMVKQQEQFAGENLSLRDMVSSSSGIQLLDSKQQSIQQPQRPNIKMVKSKQKQVKQQKQLQIQKKLVKQRQKQKQRQRQRQKVEKDQRASIVLGLKKRQLQDRMQSDYDKYIQNIQGNYLLRISQLAEMENRMKENIREIVQENQQEQVKKEVGHRMMKVHMDKIHNYKLQKEEQYKHYLQHIQSQSNHTSGNTSKRQPQSQLQRKLKIQQIMYDEGHSKQNTNSHNRLRIVQVQTQVEKVKVKGRRVLKEHMDRFQQQIVQEHNNEKIWEHRNNCKEQFIRQMQKLRQQNNYHHKVNKQHNNSYERVNSKIVEQRQQIQQLNSKLNDIRDKVSHDHVSSNTNRSNLSDKQSKLYQLLSNRTNRT